MHSTEKRFYSLKYMYNIRFVVIVIFLLLSNDKILLTSFLYTSFMPQLNSNRNTIHTHSDKINSYSRKNINW